MRSQQWHVRAGAGEPVGVCGAGPGEVHGVTVELEPGEVTGLIAPGRSPGKAPLPCGAQGAVRRPGVVKMADLCE